MIRTFLDAGVLIAAARSLGADSERALAILEPEDRVFLASPFLYLELVPKAVFPKRHLEKAFHDRYFHAAESVQDLPGLVALAQADAVRYGLSAMDALHLAATHPLRAQEFITTERPERPVYRFDPLPVTYLFG